MEHTVIVSHRGVTLHVQDGANLLEVLRSADLAPAAPCGGSGKCGKCRVSVNGREALACRTTVDADLNVSLLRQESAEVLISGQSVSVAADPVKPGYLAAFDIGTTTVVCFLLSPAGEELAAESALNPQFSYGADVISRIQQAMAGHLEAMSQLLRQKMNELIQTCCHRAQVSAEAVSVVSVVGNPCMQQLFLGISVDNLAAIPFEPVLKQAKVCPAAPYLDGCPNAELLIIPDISGYVGADTLGCILAARMYEEEDTVLMVDIGTNGEMVLVHKGRMCACSTAAGPALEGANIQFGMRGAKGAIDHVEIRDGQIRCTVIGGGKAAGICGSGLIDAVSVFLEQKLLNKRGRILSSQELEGQRILPLTEDVYLTQDDIRQVQMAKGAIAAGIHLMCAYLGITVSEVDRVILAGAFGSFMDPGSACRIGLLPVELDGRISAAGNIAGTGAKLLALNRGQLVLSQSLLERVEFIELAEQPAFQKIFARNMSFQE